MNPRPAADRVEPPSQHVGVALAAAAGVGFGLVFLAGALRPGLMLPVVLGTTGLLLAGLLIRRLGRLLLGIIVLELPFTYDVHLFYKEELGLLGALGGLNVSVMTVALSALYLLWGLRALARVPSPGSLGAALRASRPAIVYVACAAVSCLVAVDLELAGFQLALLLQLLLLHLYVTRWVRTRQDVLFVVSLLLVGLALEGLVTLFLWLTGETLTIAGLTALVGENGRVAGTIGSPTYAAGYFSLFLGTALGVLLGSAHRSLKALAACAAVFGALGLIVTLSRGGWLALAVCSTVVSFAAIRRGWMSNFVVVGGVLAAVFLAVVFQQGILARLWTADSAAAAYSRVPLLELSFRMIAANPVFGVGLNNFAAAIETYATGALALEWLYTVHNQYLLVWAESGPITLVAFLAFLGAALRAGWKAVELDDALISPLALGMTAGLVGYMVQMMTEAFAGKPLSESLWLTTALLVALAPAARRAPTDEW